MADIVSKRQTYIIVADEGGLYPANNIYPADDLFPMDAGTTVISNIVANSMKLSEIISEKVPQFGQLYATKFECQVYLTDNLSGKPIQVYQLDDNVYKPIFVGIIDSCKLDKVGTDRKIVAYDLGYIKGQINVAPWWEQFWTGKTQSTLKQCRESMLDWAGINYEDVELPNDNLIITKTVGLSNCALNAMLKMMCELNYCFPHFDRNGQLIYVMLNTDPEDVHDLTGLYDWTKSDFEEFETDEIDGVQFFDSGNELKYTVGQTNNAYPIKQNIFLYNQETATLISIGNELLEYLQDLKYTPANIKMIAGDLSFRVGDYCHTEKGDFYIFKNNLSGAQLFEQNLRADGQQVLYGGTPHMDYGEVVLSEKIARIGYDLDNFYVEIARTQKEWDVGNIEVDYFGYHDPGTTEYDNHEKYPAAGNAGKYYLNQTNGRLYLSDGTTWGSGTQLNSIQASLSSSIVTTAESIELTVARSQKEWDTTGLTITYYGYIDPRTNLTLYPASPSGHKYLNQTDGYVWTSNGTTWTKAANPLSTIQNSLSSSIVQTANSIQSTVASSQKEWDLSGKSYTISKYGYVTPTAAAFTPTNNTYYLNQSNGYVYKGNGSSWVYVEALTSIQSAMSSQITQTVNGITMTVSNNTANTQATITLKNGSTTIDSGTINLTGLVKFTNLSNSGETTINGNNITTGIIQDRATNPRFYIRFSDGYVFMNNAAFTGTITGSTIQTKEVGTGAGNYRILMDTSATLKGMRGNTLYNYIDMMQPSGTQMNIFANDHLNIMTPLLSVGTSTSSVTATVTSNSLRRITSIRKIVATEGSPYNPDNYLKIKEGNVPIYNENMQLVDAAYCQLPVILLIEGQDMNFIHGMVTSNESFTPIINT